MRCARCELSERDEANMTFVTVPSQEDIRLRKYQKDSVPDGHNQVMVHCGHNVQERLIFTYEVRPACFCSWRGA